MDSSDKEDLCCIGIIILLITATALASPWIIWLIVKYYEWADSVIGGVLCCVQ